MPVYGMRPEDVVVDAAGNVQSGATLTLHASQADAQAASNPLTTVTTSAGRWSADITQSPVWVRTPNGAVYEIADFAAKADKTYVDSQIGGLSSTFVPQSVIDTTQAAHVAQIAVPSASTKNGMRITNAANSYGLKVDQSGAGGVHDTVNIAANFAGAHTPFSVNSLNDTLSTVKIVNSAAQTGGAIIAAVGDNSARTVSLFNGDNSGAGPTYLSTMKPTGTGIAFQAAYDQATSYTSRAAWINASHTGGDLLTIENAKAQTAGSMIRLIQNSASTTAPVIYINNSGTGEHILADNFAVTKAGQIKAAQIYNFTSFNNGRVQLGTTGVQVDRNVADANPTLKISSVHASATGDTIQILGAGSVYGSRFNKDAYFITKKNAAPANVDIVAGEVAMWFDSTNGAAKVMFLAKQADGTVRTGSVALA